MKVISVKVGLLLLLVFSSFSCFAQSSEPAQPPQTAKELLKAGYDQLDAGDLEGALATANRILEMDPNSGSAAVLHFVAFDNKYPNGNPTADCNRVIELAPSKDWVEAAYITRGNYRLIVRQLDQAIEDFDHAIAMDPMSLHAYQLRSYTYMEKGDFVNTRADYQKSLGIDPSSPSPFVVRGFWLKAGGHFREALTDVQTAIEWKPDYAEAFVDRGVIFGLTGNLNDCIADFNQARALKPAVFSDERKNGVGSSPFWDLNPFVTKNPANPRGYEMRAVFRLLQGKTGEANQDFQKAVELGPELKSEIEVLKRTFAQP